MTSGVNGKTIAVVTGGAVLMYAGIKGLKISTITRGLLSGQDPTTLSPDNTLGGTASVIDHGNVGDTTTARKRAEAMVRRATGSGSHRGPVVAATPGSRAAFNQQIARLLAAPYGWSAGTQFADLVELWQGESGWSQYADTRKSGLDAPDAAVFAYGIPQSRPYSKMAKAAWPADKGGHSDPTSQIAWGLRYIKEAYGSPSAALSFKYGAGGGKGY